MWLLPITGRSVLWTAGLIMVVALGGIPTGWARPPEIRQGDFVFPITRAPVMDKDQVLTYVSPGTRLVAHQVRGPWVLVAVKTGSSTPVVSDQGLCPDCGHPDWTRAARFVGPPFRPRNSFPGQSPPLPTPPFQWIRGWVYVHYLRRHPDCEESTISFDNQSPHVAVVRLVGPTRAEVYVPQGQSRTVRFVAAGHYFPIIRYANETTAVGEHFDVDASDTTYSKITITLHGVVHGNYSTASVPASVFDAWGDAEREFP